MIDTGHTGPWSPAAPAEPARCKCGSVLTVADRGLTCRQCLLAERVPARRRSFQPTGSETLS